MRHNIFARIDDRLIHGQIAVKWIPFLGVKHVVVIDDELYKNEFLKKVALAAAPKEIDTSIVNTENAYAKIAAIDGKVLLLAKKPETYEKLIREGLNIKKINIGGVGSDNSRRLLYRNIYLSDEERESIKNIEKSGVIVEIQIIPEDKPIEYSKLI
jgi:PTS system mannose-specific IIB component